MNTKILTLGIAKVGMKVVRGRDWEYNDEDGINGNTGVIDRIKKHDDYPIKVLWPNGNEYCYRASKYESQVCDLYMIVDHNIKEEYVKEAQKFFKINNPAKISKEMLISNNKEEWLNI